MTIAAHRSEAPSAVRSDLNAIFVSIELSQSKWLITSLSPEAGGKLSKFTLPASDVAGMLTRFAELQRKAKARTGQAFPLVVIQEAGLDGFWVHRVLEGEGIESHVVDPASIAVSRRKRRVKTDRIDGEMLVRALLAYKRGEPRVCAMVRAPTPEEEDRRRVPRERKALTIERTRHTNRSLVRVSTATGRFARTGANGWTSLRPATGARFLSSSRRRSAANSTVSNW
jgi:transposase